MTACRISKVRFKDGRELRILPTEVKDTEFIRTLVWCLDGARKGDVRSYAVVMRVEREDGAMSTIEAADVLADEDGGDLNMILGGIERMKMNLMWRESAMPWQREG